MITNNDFVLEMIDIIKEHTDKKNIDDATIKFLKLIEEYGYDPDELAKVKDDDAVLSRNYDAVFEEEYGEELEEDYD